MITLRLSYVPNIKDRVVFRLIFERKFKKDLRALGGKQKMIDYFQDKLREYFGLEDLRVSDITKGSAVTWCNIQRPLLAPILSKIGEDGFAFPIEILQQKLDLKKIQLPICGGGSYELNSSEETRIWIEKYAQILLKPPSPVSYLTDSESKSLEDQNENTSDILSPKEEPLAVEQQEISAPKIVLSSKEKLLALDLEQLESMLELCSNISEDPSQRTLTDRSVVCSLLRWRDIAKPEEKTPFDLNNVAHRSVALWEAKILKSKELIIQKLPSWLAS